RNQLDSLIYSTEKLLNENKEKIPADDAKAVEEALAEGKKALESNEAETMKSAIERINTASHKMAEVMYKAASAAAPPPPGPEAGGQPEGNVVDAEVVDEKEKK
ncbi:MAG TPA: Hsp70 family protein, partial [Thermodesulfobacteriota bacterium]|nr:Hsp70 family protein [Thermodesulfobacteriota bacterium]